jgi:hypothetical protein
VKFPEKTVALVRAGGSELLVNAGGAGGYLIIPNQKGLIEAMKNGPMVNVFVFSNKGRMMLDAFLDGARQAIDIVMNECPEIE